MKRISLIGTLIVLLAACGGRDGGDFDGDSDVQLGYSDYQARPTDFSGITDSLFTETSDGQFVSQTPSESLDEPISAEDLKALTSMFSELGRSDQQQVQFLLLDMLDACRFFGGGNRPCGPGSPWGCAANFVTTGGDFFITLMGHLAAQAPLSSDTDPATVMAEEVGLCDSVPLRSPNFKTHMENAKQQCIRGELRGCIRFGLSLIKMFLQALMGAVLGALGI